MIQNSFQTQTNSSLVQTLVTPNYPKITTFFSSIRSHAQQTIQNWILQDQKNCIKESLKNFFRKYKLLTICESVRWKYSTGRSRCRVPHYCWHEEPAVPSPSGFLTAASTYSASSISLPICFCPRSTWSHLSSRPSLFGTCCLPPPPSTADPITPFPRADRRFLRCLRHFATLFLG